MNRNKSETSPLPEMSAEDMAEHAGEAATLLRALANPKRLMILCVLSEGEQSVSDLNEQVPLSQSALSQHLFILRRDGLVETRRKRQNVYYRLAQGPAIEIMGALHDIYCGKE